MLYRALDMSKDEFRLLSIAPQRADEGETSPVRCSLKHASLNHFSRRSSSSYIAVSYTWGDATERVPIIIDDRVTEVTKNLGIILHLLRSQKATSTPLWIDALCINQADVMERNVQVKRMINIYRRATKVFVWLGPEFPGLTSAIKAVESVFNDLLEIQRTNAMELGFSYHSFDEMVWMALCELLDLPYWSRVWIVQELAVRDSDDIIVSCGKYGIEMTQLSIVMNAMIRTIGHWPATADAARSASWKVDMPRLLYNRAPLMKMIGQAMATPDPQSFSTLLLVMQASQSTDPRDLVYGLLGLFDAETSRRITPDYRLTVAQVYGSFTKAAIEAHQDLSIIYKCPSGTRRPSGWPSWVPDFQDIKRNVYNPSFFPSEGFNASGSGRLETRFSPDLTTMYCKGIIAGEVDGHGRTTTFGRFCQSRCPNEDKGIDDIADTLFRVLISAVWDGGKYAARPLYGLAELMAPDPVNDQGRDFLERNHDFELGPKSMVLMDYVLRSEKAQEEDGQARREAELANVSGWLTGRKLVITMEGRIGLVMNEAERGDQIAIISGCKVPILLRPADSALGLSFKVVGPCYIDGLMHGELFWLPQPMRELRII